MSSAYTLRNKATRIREDFEQVLLDIEHKKDAAALLIYKVGDRYEAMFAGKTDQRQRELLHDKVAAITV